MLKKFINGLLIVTFMTVITTVIFNQRKIDNIKEANAKEVQSTVNLMLVEGILNNEGQTFSVKVKDGKAITFGEVKGKLNVVREVFSKIHSEGDYEIYIDDLGRVKII